MTWLMILGAAAALFLLQVKADQWPFYRWFGALLLLLLAMVAWVAWMPA